MFFGKAESVTLDGQGRLLVPQRLRHEAGIGKEAVVLGVSDRMEIWDRTAHERYETAHAGAYQAGTLAPGARGSAQG
jgi:MraZ protein